MIGLIELHARRLLSRPSRYRYLYDIILRHRCRRIAEIGVWNGRQAASMIRAAAALHPRYEILYHGFDLFEALTDDDLKDELSKRPPSEAEVAGLLTRTGVEFHLHAGYTQDTLKAYAEEREQRDQLDFVFLDGGHAIETITSDWHWVSQIMTPHTVVLFDDYYHNPAEEVPGLGCQTLIDQLDRKEYDVEVLPIVNSFPKDSGALHVGMAKVVPRAKRTG